LIQVKLGPQAVNGSKDHGLPTEFEVSMRSLLFIPGDSPKKLDKGLGSGADALLLDLEDSIAPPSKAAARATTTAFLKETRTAKDRPRLYVRINGLATGLTDDDLDAVVAAAPDGIMFPKAEGGAAVIHCDAKITAREAIAGLPDGGIDIIAIATETAKALFLAGTYAGASKRLKGLTWGAEDLSAELGAEANRDGDGNFLAPYQLARSLCLAGAAAAQVQAIDTVYVDFRNEAGLRRECEEARRDGFTGKLAIHPAQVAVINEVFTPTADAIKRAEAVIAAFAANPGAGTIGIGGVMYDRPHLERARQLLARVKR
jgi:citrate lyase subunit beta / citryl-CoA lyase